MKALLFIILFLSVSISFESKAQTTSDWNSIATGQYLYDFSSSPFVFFYRLDFILDENRKKMPIDTFLRNLNINFDTVNYARLKHNDETYIGIQRSDKTTRLFKLLKEKEKYLILCSDNSDINKCKANTFIYLPNKNVLQRIERPFSFSLKKDALKRFDKLGIDYPKDNNFRSLAELIEKL